MLKKEIMEGFWVMAVKISSNLNQSGKTFLEKGFYLKVSGVRASSGIKWESSLKLTHP